MVQARAQIGKVDTIVTVTVVTDGIKQPRFASIKTNVTEITLVAIMPARILLDHTRVLALLVISSVTAIDVRMLMNVCMQDRVPVEGCASIHSVITSACSTPVCLVTSASRSGVLAVGSVARRSAPKEIESAIEMCRNLTPLDQ